MKTEHICPSCKKTLPEGAPQGLCPECLMKAGFGSSAGVSGGNPRFVPPSVGDLAKHFPQLEILELIGQGGMGAVYKARQPGLDRLVALKILPPESTATPGFAERFAREARALAKLNHPNIVNVYDFGQVAGLHYFLMEYVDGMNLRQLVHGGRLSPREALQIVPQMCDALQFAHDEGIVHRDIKPENVMLDKRGRVKITDFGLAKLLGRELENLQLTGARDIMGTPNYMAPEQVEKPNAVDHRADIYSLGVVFYELLTGELPIGKFSPPSQKVSVDVRLDEVVLHTLEKEPARRYQHASQIKTDVENISHTPGSVPPPAVKSPEAVKLEDAYRQVNGPATGLVVTAILNWIGIPLILLVCAYLIFSREGGSRALLALPVCALVLSGLMLVAGLKMKRLQAYWLAIAGSVLAVLVTPGNLVGLPIGIWSLVVLSQKRVRSCFGQEHQLPLWQPPSGPARGGSWKVAAVIVGAVLLVLAVPVGALLVSITLPAIHRAKAISQYAAEFGPVTEVTLREVTLSAIKDGGSEGLDLDGGQVVGIPAEIVTSTHESEVAKRVAGIGIDLLLVRELDHWLLATPNTAPLALQLASNELWNHKYATNLSPSQVTIENGIWRTYKLTTGTQLPLTFSFETAGGKKGLLRITGLRQDPDQATMQFKARKN